MQTALNAIWKVEPRGSSISRLVRARAASLGLVGALGFLLLVSLVVSTAIAAMSDVINANLPFGTMILGVINTLVSFALITAMFAAIYKVLPDRRLGWRDVITGALVTAALFTLGKSIIGWYIGTSATASSYGAAGGLLVILLWVFYSSQIFLFGAEITRAYSVRHGSRSDLESVVDANLITSSIRRSGSSASPYSSDLTWVSLIAMAVGVGMLVARLVLANRPR